MINNKALLPFLKIGTTAPASIIRKKISFNKLRLKMWHKREVNIPEQPFIIKLGILSGPVYFI
jgi:hypothetical protein